jgi:hypothetical protein
LSQFTAARSALKPIRSTSFIALTLLTAAFAPTQTIATQQKMETAVGVAPSAQSNTITTQDLDNLEPSVTERIARSWQYQYQLLEQPAFIVATSGTMTETIPNPNKWLQQHSVVVQLSELFPRTTNLPGLVQAAYDLKDRDSGTPVTFGKGVCPAGKKVLECLAGGGNFFERLFSGASVTFSVAQRDEVQQGVLVPDLPVSQSWAWNYEIDFNPASLFTTSTSWKTAVAVLGKDPSGQTRNFGLDDSRMHQCLVKVLSEMQTSQAQCLKEFAKPRLDSSKYPSWLSNVAAVAIPTLQFKSLSQFDFIKQGGVLTENPQLQRSLKNLTLTWDLRRIIPATTDKLAVGTLYAAARKPTKPNNDTVLAESMVVIGDRSLYEAGDLLAIDPSAKRHLAKAQEAYSTLVAGVYSPSALTSAQANGSGENSDKDSVPLTVAGIASCKVTTENGPIQPGDLLVASSTTGHAMKGTDRTKMLGAVVGKALEPLSSGSSGLIQILVTLQ